MLELGNIFVHEREGESWNNSFWIQCSVLPTLDNFQKWIWKFSYIDGWYVEWKLPIFLKNGKSDGLNYVWSSMFDAKIGCLNSITKIWTRSSLFDVRKNDVWICSMNNLVNLFYVWCSMYICSKPKVSSCTIINRWKCLISFNVQNLMFDKMVLDLVTRFLKWV